MYNVIICDDDPNITSRYEILLNSIAEKHNTNIFIDKYANGEQLLFHLEENPHYADIIFLDIIMGEMNGIETAKNLRNIGSDAQIIFLTTSDEYVFDAFEVKPLNYIIKEKATIKIIEDCFMKAVEASSHHEQDSYPIEKGQTTIRVPYNQIEYFDVNNRTVTCHTTEEAIDFYYRLDKIEEELKEKGFIRTHRSIVVNIRYIKNIENNAITLRNGKTIPLATRKYGEVKKQFTTYIRRNI